VKMTMIFYLTMKLKCVNQAVVETVPQDCMFSDSRDKENSEEAITVGMVGYPNVGKSSMVDVSDNV
jgi:ribosome biogenesis GTPase A